MTRLLYPVLVLLAGCGNCDSAEPRPPPSPPVADVTAWSSLDPPAAPGALGASLTSDADGVLATWIEPRGTDAHAVLFARLEGESWGDTALVAESAELVANWADFPRAARGGDGAIYVHWAKRSGEAAYAYEVQLARSRDGGRSFEAMGAVHRDGTPTEHGFVSFVPVDGGVRMFWLDGRATVEEGGATAVYTTTVAAEIAQAERVDERACDCCQTDAVQGPDGPMVVFRDREDGEVRDISIARADGDGFGPATPVHRDGWEIAGCPVNGPAIAAEAERVVVAWFTGAEGGAVLAAFSDDGGATFGDPIVVDPDQPPGRVDAVLVPGGAAVSWLARSGADAEVRVGFVSAAGDLGAPTVVARTAAERVSGFPVLARDGERLLIAHRDGADPPRIHVSTLRAEELPKTRDATPPREEPTPSIAIGAPMPDVHLKGPEDEMLALSDVAAGRALVVAFFARWCQPCREELRELEQLRTEIGEAAEVVVVSLDEGSALRAAAVAEGWGFTGRVLRDHDAAVALGIPPIPALFYFDADGVLRRAWRGERPSPDELAGVVEGAGRSPDEHHGAVHVR